MSRVAVYIRHGRASVSKVPDAYLTVGSYQYTYHKVTPVALPSFVVVS